MNDDTTNAISVSLMNRSIYAVCYTGAQPLSDFHGDLYFARLRFFTERRAAKVDKDGYFCGLAGTLIGKISKHAIRWEKRAGKRVLEQSFQHGSQRGVAYYEPNGVLSARVFFDRNQYWVCSEYYDPGDPDYAVLRFKPDATRDVVLRFDYDRFTGQTKETELYPVPYAYQTPEQSLQNADCGDEFFLVADNTGESLYCPKDEQARRLEFLSRTSGASVLYTMGWEVRDGDVRAEAEPERPAPVFPALQEPVVQEPETEIKTELEPAEYEAADVAEPAVPAAEEKPAEVETAEPIEKDEETEPDGALPEPDPALDRLGITAEEARQVQHVLTKIFAAETGSGNDTAETARGISIVRAGKTARYTGTLIDGKREGTGKTETEDGLTLYQGEYKDDRRDGFGIHHYRSGAVSYVGAFREDERDGFGVSFRESDHAVHVANWESGKPGDYATLFGPDGALRYSGRIVDGQKQGAGISVNPEDRTVFVAKYQDNEMTGEGALFAADGTLLYVGGWKDGKRNGHGTEFDRAGNVVYSGEWKDDAYLNGVLYKRVRGDAGSA